MPKAAKTHAQNRACVCLICFKNGSSMTKIGGITLEQVKRFYLEKFDQTDSMLPNGVCAHCRKVLLRIDSGEIDATSLPDPIDFSTLTFPKVTRSITRSGIFDLDAMTHCTCSICKVANQEVREILQWRLLRSESTTFNQQQCASEHQPQSVPTSITYNLPSNLTYIIIINQLVFH